MSRGAGSKGKYCILNSLWHPLHLLLLLCSLFHPPPHFPFLQLHVSFLFCRGSLFSHLKKFWALLNSTYNLFVVGNPEATKEIQNHSLNGGSPFLPQQTANPHSPWHASERYLIFYREPKDLLDIRYCSYFFSQISLPNGLSLLISTWQRSPLTWLLPIFVFQGEHGDDGIDGLDGEEVSHFSSSTMKSSWVWCISLMGNFALSSFRAFMDFLGKKEKRVIQDPR